MIKKTPKTGGPKSIPGKIITSKNATTHGITSKSLLNIDEQSRYESFVNNLKKQYSQNNPLITLQIDRIARIYIQLERIQRVMDALFEESKNDQKISNALAERLGLDTIDQITIRHSKSQSRLSTTHIIDDQLIKLSNPNVIKMNRLTHLQEITSEDLLAHCPALAHYFHEQCQQARGKHINRYLQDMINDAPSESSKIRDHFHQLLEQLTNYEQLPMTPDS